LAAGAGAGFAGRLNGGDGGLGLLLGQFRFGGGEVAGQGFLEYP